MKTMINRTIRLLLAAAIALSPVYAYAVSSFVQNGTSSAVVVFTSSTSGVDLSALASGSTTQSVTGCTSGVCDWSSDMNKALWASVFLTPGAAFGGTPTAGSNISCWFMPSTDGGTTFESMPSNSIPPQRAADFVFSLAAMAITTTNRIFANGRDYIRLPLGVKFKVGCQNNSGQTMGTAANTITIQPGFTGY